MVSIVTPYSDDVREIEHFRKEIQEKLSAKGVIPPSPGSDQEKILYKQWLEGKKKITDVADVN